MTPLLVYWMQPIFTKPILAIAPAHSLTSFLLSEHSLLHEEVNLNAQKQEKSALVGQSVL